VRCNEDAIKNCCNEMRIVHKIYLLPLIQNAHSLTQKPVSYIYYSALLSYITFMLMKFHLKIVALIFFAGMTVISHAQHFDPGDIPADSWAKLLKERSGTISALWYDIEPFIYRTGRGPGMAGVEYELMESFVKYIRDKYHVDLKLKWVDAKSFENIYPYITHTKKSAVFGWSYYSITEERKKDVKFTPAYMPDVNIIVTDIGQPLYATNEDFIKNLEGKTAYTMRSTMMEQDILTIKNNFYKELPVNGEYDDYAVMEKISQHQDAFGYVPLSIYVMALQKGIKVKRQVVLPSRRDGFAGIYPKGSDWDKPVNEYFSSDEFAKFSAAVIKKYLGNQVTDLIFKASLPDSLRSAQNDNEMLTLEKEIVSKNLVASDEKVLEQKVIRNTIIAVIVVAFVVMLILYGMYAAKQQYAKLLQQRNDIIIKQKEEIEMMNRKLEMKVMLAEMNPHLVFNSLNAVQYFITLDEKKNALKYLSSFSKHLRLMMDNASSLMVTVDNEIKMLRQYLELEQVRFENKFSFTIESTLHNGEMLIEMPSMLIHLLVESALYNEVLKINDQCGFISIGFAKNENCLLVQIEHSSAETATIVQAMETGNSFDNSYKKIMERIELINYGKQHKVSIEKNNKVLNKASVTIKIPVNNYS
jgi:hypothetical protein